MLGDYNSKCESSDVGVLECSGRVTRQVGSGTVMGICMEMSKAITDQFL